MRLRSKRSGHYRTTQRTRRLALALALASGSLTTAVAQPPLPSLPLPTSQTQCVEPGLLPYPFGSNSQEAFISTSASQRILELLGLAKSGSKTQATFASTEAPRANSSAAIGTCPESIVGPCPEPKSGIALAAAVDSATKGGATGVDGSVVVPASTSHTEKFTDMPAEGTGESLIDIEVPLVVIRESKSELTRVVPAVPPKSSRESDRQVEKPAEREPRIVGEPKSMKLTIESSDRSAASATFAPRRVPPPSVDLSTPPIARDNCTKDPNLERPESVSFNFNDSDDKNRKVGLHLSTSSSISLHTKSTPLPSSQGARSGVDKGSVPGIDVSTSPPSPKVAGAPPKSAIPSVRNASSASPIFATFASRKTTVLNESSPLDPMRNMKVKESLTLSVHDTHSFAMETSIAELSVEHPEVCLLLKTGDKSVSLIGISPGSTRIAVVMSLQNGKQEIEVREVTVGSSSPSTVVLPQLARDISKSISQLYPDSDVQIVASKDHLLVRGFAAHEDDAKQILALVRKTSLAPVVDQLQTYRK